MKQSFGSGRGSVYNIIMKSLQSGDKYGYEICQEIEKKTNGHYILKQPSLYSGLKRLEAQKCVESYWGDSEIGGRRHYYRLTDIGKKKLESSKFTWEDERQTVVGDLFKKDEIDENLDEIKQEIDTTKQSIEQNDQLNKEILSTFENENTQRESTEVVLANNDIKNNQQQPIQPAKKQTNSFSHKVNDNQFDLFSFVEQKETYTEDEIKENTEAPIEEQEKQIDETIQQDIVQETKPNEQIEENNEIVENNEQKVEQEETNEEEIKEELNQIEENNIQTSPLENANEDKNIGNEENIENIEKKEEKTVKADEINDQIDIKNHQAEFDFLFAEHKSTSFADSTEDLESSISPIQDLQKSFTFYGADNIANDDAKIDDDFEKRYAEFEKQFNEEKVEENQKTEQVEQEKNEEQERIEQEKRMSDILSEGFSSVDRNIFQTQTNYVENQSNDSEKYSFNEPNENMNQSNDNTSQNSESNGIDLKAIFGDYIKDEPLKENQEQKQDDDYSTYNDIYFKKDYIGNINSNTENGDISNQNSFSNFVNEMPQFDLSDNINYSLKPTNEKTNYENKKYGDYYENNNHSNFEKNNQSISKQNTEEKQSIEAPTNVNDIKIRYLRKNFLEEKISGYIAINKLNFYSSLICSLFVAIASLIGYFVIKNHIAFDYIQKVMIILDVIVICVYLSVFYIRFVFDSHKKIKYVEDKRKIVKALIISLIGILAVVLLNMFVLNFDIINILSFYSSFIVPICILISFDMFFLVRNILIKKFN